MFRLVLPLGIYGNEFDLLPRAIRARASVRWQGAAAPVVAGDELVPRVVPRLNVVPA